MGPSTAPQSTATAPAVEHQNMSMHMGPQPWMNSMGMMRQAPLYQPSPQLLNQTAELHKEHASAKEETTKTNQKPIEEVTGNIVNAL